MLLAAILDADGLQAFVGWAVFLSLVVLIAVSIYEMGKKEGERKGRREAFQEFQKARRPRDPANA